MFIKSKLFYFLELKNSPGSVNIDPYTISGADASISSLWLLNNPCKAVGSESTQARFFSWHITLAFNDRCHGPTSSNLVPWSVVIPWGEPKPIEPIGLTKGQLQATCLLLSDIRGPTISCKCVKYCVHNRDSMNWVLLRRPTFERCMRCRYQSSHSSPYEFSCNSCATRGRQLVKSFQDLTAQQLWGELPDDTRRNSADDILCFI